MICPSRLVTILFAALLAAILLLGCAGDGHRRPAGAFQDASEPALRIVYPPAGATLTAGDSTFIFGSVTPASATVSVNGVSALQAPGGGWLAYVPISAGEFVFHVEARAAGSPPGEAAASRLARMDWPVRVPGFVPTWAGVLDSSSVSPKDSLELHPGDPLVVRFRGLAGLSARAVLGEGLAASRLVEEPAAAENVGRRVFGSAEGGLPPSEALADSANGGTGAGGRPPGGAAAAKWSWYRTEIRIPGSIPRWQVGAWVPLWIEINRPRKLRYPLPSPVRLRDPQSTSVALLDDDPGRTGRSDGRVVGRTGPDGVYFLFLPNGTRARTARRMGELVELPLAPDLSVWSARSELHPLEAGVPGPRSTVPVVRTRALGEWTRVLVPLTERLPVQIRQDTQPARYEVTIFGARAAAEFMRYDGADSLVREVRWNQAANERFVLEVELDQAEPWGFRYGYRGTTFYLDVRRAPVLAAGLFRSILDDLTVVVDPGHSPDSGAVGPTGLLEKDVNLAVGLELARQLREEGARVILTRAGEAPPHGLGLNDRTNLAARAEADLLVSVHHNAVPDGVNPFENNGTSVYYYHPQSLRLARGIHRELLDALELPDFGIGHGNLALVRATEMPAVLAESAFMMIPEQEEMLRTPEFQEREARAIVRGIKRFLKETRAANARR